MSLNIAARRQGRRLLQGWQRFWFTDELAFTLGIVRIGFGLLLIGWTYVLASDLNVAFGANGVVPNPPSRTFTWGVFHTYPGDSAILIGWLVLMGAAVALTVGWHSRLAAVLAFVLIMSFERRNPVIFNSGDTVIRIVALYLALAPCGAALSMDQRRRTGSFFSAREFRPWPLRLLQIQLTIVYFSTVVAKLAGETWQNGTAVAYSLRQHDLLVVPAPKWVTDNLLVSNVLTWGTLVIELAIAVLVWKRAWRPWVLAAGVALHLSISVFLEVGFFSCAMFVLYLAFIPPDRAQALAVGVQARMMRLRKRLQTRARNDGSAEKTDLQEDSIVPPAESADLPVGSPLIIGDRDGASPRRLAPADGMADAVSVASADHPGRHHSGPVPDLLDMLSDRRSTDEPTGRHARRPGTDKLNGELAGHAW